MISAFYQDSPTKNDKISRRKGSSHPFIIPNVHLNASQQQVSNLKKQCQEYKQEFTFITTQIQREARLKKEKTNHHLQMPATLMQHAMNLKAIKHKSQQKDKKVQITRSARKQKTTFGGGFRNKDKDINSEEKIEVGPSGIIRTIFSVK